MPRPTLSPEQLAVGGASLSLAGSAWALWLMRVGAAVPTFGRICGHAVGQLHCPACYASLALAALGLCVAAGGLTARVRPARA